MVAVVDIGGYSAAGNRYGSLNQDFVVARSLTPPATSDGALPDSPHHFVGAVLDGHGILGEAAAAAAGDALLQYLASSAVCKGPLAAVPDAHLAQLMQAAFQHCHERAIALYDDPPKEAQYPRSCGQTAKFELHHANGVQMYRTNGSLPPQERVLECGTTCSVVLTQGDQLCVANVGDSTAVLGSYDCDGMSARVLTVQHSGLNLAEAERITSQHGQHARIEPSDGYLAITSGAWAGYQLSVTRALGHKHLRGHGVVAEPSVRRCTLQPQDCCLVVASDGVWDVMGAQEVVNRVMDVVSDGGDAMEAAKHLVTEAIELALGSPHADADNASAVVLLLG